MSQPERMHPPMRVMYKVHSPYGVELARGIYRNAHNLERRRFMERMEDALSNNLQVTLIKVEDNFIL